MLSFNASRSIFLHSFLSFAYLSRVNFLFLSSLSSFRVQNRGSTKHLRLKYYTNSLSGSNVERERNAK